MSGDHIITPLVICVCTSLWSSSTANHHEIHAHTHTLLFIIINLSCLMVIVVQHTNNISHLHLHFSKPFNVSVQNCRAKATTIKQLQMNMNKMKKKKKAQHRAKQRNTATTKKTDTEEMQEKCCMHPKNVHLYMYLQWRTAAVSRCVCMCCLRIARTLVVALLSTARPDSIVVCCVCRSLFGHWLHCIDFVLIIFFPI